MGYRTSLASTKNNIGYQNVLIETNNNIHLIGVALENNGKAVVSKPKRDRNRTPNPKIANV